MNTTLVDGTQVQVEETQGRILGVRHRVKKTAEGDAHPTQLYIRSGQATEVIIDLEDDQAEFDFLKGYFPTKYRPATENDRLEDFRPHQIKWKKLSAVEKETGNYPAHLIRLVGTNGKSFEVADKVPAEYAGVQKGDIFTMGLGGSGDRFASALANRGTRVGASVHRIPPFLLKEKRGDGSKDNDAKLLTDIFSTTPDLFYVLRARDRALIRVRETLRLRIDTMKARIGCEQRLRQSYIGKIYLNEEGEFPEGDIEAAFDAIKASNAILTNLLNEEKAANRELQKACEALDVYTMLFGPIEGIGPAIASRIISAICDIRMFPTKAKLKAFMGAHVLKGGRFPRRRGGEIANWHPDARQALYLFAEQCNKRPGSTWGRKLREIKAKFRVKHPVPVTVAEWLNPIFRKLTTTLFDRNPSFVFNKADLVIKTPEELIELTKAFDPGDDIVAALEAEISAVQNSTKSRSEKPIKIYSDGHIQKMALWRTASKLVEWLWSNWWNIENGKAINPVVVSPASDPSPVSGSSPDSEPPDSSDDESSGGGTSTGSAGTTQNSATEATAEAA